jgi:hypothetical protein
MSTKKRRALPSRLVLRCGVTRYARTPAIRTSRDGKAEKKT